MFWKIVAGLLGGAALLGAGILIYKRITRSTIAEESRKKCPAAFKAIIKSNDTKKVNVGIFDRNDNHLDDLTLQSEKGVDSSLKKGTVVYC